MGFRIQGLGFKASRLEASEGGLNSCCTTFFAARPQALLCRSRRPRLKSLDHSLIGCWTLRQLIWLRSTFCFTQQQIRPFVWAGHPFNSYVFLLLLCADRPGTSAARLSGLVLHRSLLQDCQCWSLSMRALHSVFTCGHGRAVVPSFRFDRLHGEQL